MFQLNQKTIKELIKKINIITITYYKSKSDLFNVYDCNFPVNENIVPMITSVLEKEPKLYNAKKYITIDGESVIYHNNAYHSGNAFACFFTDLKDDKSQYIVSYDNKLVNVIDDGESNLLVRMYNMEKMSNKFEKNILEEEEMFIIIWEMDYLNIQLIFPKDNKRFFQLQININIPEDNKLILDRVENVNNVLNKIQLIFDEMINLNP